MSCGYCHRDRILYFTGRRTICRECFVEHLGEDPESSGGISAALRERDYGFGPIGQRPRQDSNLRPSP